MLYYHRNCLKQKKCFCLRFCFLFTSQVYEDVAAVVREKPFGAWGAWWEPSSQNTQEVFYSHLTRSKTENFVYCCRCP